MGLEPELGFAPDLAAIPADVLERARLMFINYPNNPTGAIVPDGLFERAIELARANDILVVHDNAYSRDDLRRLRRPVVSRHPGRQGGRGRGLLALQGLQHDRLAVRGDRRQRRGDRPVLAAEVQHRLGAVRGDPAGRGRRSAPGGRRRRSRDERRLRAPARPGVRRAAPGGGAGHPAAGDDLRVGAGPGRVRLGRRVLRARARAGRGRDLARRRLRPQRRGVLPHLADHPRRSPAARPSTASAACRPPAVGGRIEPGWSHLPVLTETAPGPNRPNGVPASARS